MTATRRLIIHIGLEKTGTSSLQACLHHSEAALQRHAVVCPRRNLGYGWMNHKPLVGCYGIEDVGDKWLPVAPQRRQAIVESVIEDIRHSAAARTAVLSAEHFSSRFREEQIRDLQADFAAFDCRVLIVLRDHLSRLCSLWETYVTNGGALPLDEYALGMMRPESLDLRFADLIAPWERVFGRDRLDLVAYGPDVLPAVLSRLDPDLARDPGIQAQHLRTSAGARVVSALRLANAMGLAGAAASQAGWVRDTQHRAQIRQWLQAADRQAGAGWPLADDILAKVQTLADTDRARLRSDYGFDLPSSERPTAAASLVEAEAAELLARALVAQAARPWTRSSVIGAGLALAVTLRQELSALRQRYARHAV